MRRVYLNLSIHVGYMSCYLINSKIAVQWTCSSLNTRPATIALIISVFAVKQTYFVALILFYWTQLNMMAFMCRRFCCLWQNESIHLIQLKNKQVTIFIEVHCTFAFSVHIYVLKIILQHKISVLIYTECCWAFLINLKW